ncbi:hypothetical protein [Actinoplanes sp. OR16]|uniref:DMP19 family protein n=1 Tax=Actinoplanes sp. OR16 TaxID=946334 RepID=UPI000FDA90C1|nr:hypothetical protein [Actinoplanes sp. OR16]
MKPAFTPSEADLVWNRAAAQRGDGAGDRHLSALLLAHGAVMNGGPGHAASSLGSAELDAAVAGFRYFGLKELASVVQQFPEAGSSDEEEDRLNEAYLVLAPEDSLLFDAFAAKFFGSPSDFEPIKEQR